MLKTDTIVWLVRNGDLYSHEEVNDLVSDIKKYSTIPLHFVCFSSCPQVNSKINSEIILYETRPWHGLEGFWPKMDIFKLSKHFTNRNFYFDLDTIVYQNIDDLFNIPLEEDDPIFLVDKDQNPIWEKRGKLESKYNSSIMAWNSKSKHVDSVINLWDDCADEVPIQYLGNDDFMYGELRECIGSLPYSKTWSWIRNSEVRKNNYEEKYAISLGNGIFSRLDSNDLFAKIKKNLQSPR